MSGEYDKFAIKNIFNYTEQCTLIYSNNTILPISGYISNIL